MFRFAHPQLLWLLWLLPLLLILFLLARRDRRRRLARFGNPALLGGLMPEVSAGRVRLKFLLLCAAVACLVVAAARPQLGSKLREERAEGVELMLAVDVSNSMLAEDFAPNRLERTKYAVERLIEGLRQDRVGLIVFAGEARVLLPVTSDLRMARAAVRRIDPSLVAVQGTDLSGALTQALLSFSSSTDTGGSRAVVLITDGEDHGGGLAEAADRAAEAGIRIYTVGIGTPEGAPIELDGEFIRDEKGDMVVSKLDEQSLGLLAERTGGAYLRATERSLGLEEIVGQLNAMEQSELATVRFEEYDEQYGWFVGAALLFVVAEAALLGRRNPRLARFNIFRRERRGIDPTLRDE